MARNDDIQLYEPEGLDPRAPLDGETRAHLDVHRAIEEAGLEWKRKAKVSFSADFDERLLARLEASRGEQAEPLNDADFAPVAGAGEAAFLTRRGFLGAAAAILFFIFGAIWVQGYREIQNRDLAPPAAAPSRESASDAASSPVPPPGVTMPTHRPPLSAPEPARPAAERAGAAPAPPAATESEAQKRSVWSEDSTPDPEMLLRDRIQAEQDPAKKRELMKQLLRLYEGSGQTQKAAELRKQL